jgi:hypothetical protein
VNPVYRAAIRGVVYAHAGVQAGSPADTAPRNSGPDFGKASPFGLLVVVLLLISVMFLMRSMNRHLRQLPDSFDPQTPAPGKGRDQDLDSDARTLADGTIGDEPAQGHPDGRLPDEPGPVAGRPSDESG